MHTSSANPLSKSDRQIRWSYRDIPLSHASHAPGRVAWMPPPQSVPVESRLEAKVLAFLVSHANLAAVHSQPFTLTYKDGGNTRTYTPDFLVVFTRVPKTLRLLGFDRWTAVEVKPACHLDSQNSDVPRRLQAVRDRLCFATVCLTERDLPSGRVSP